MYIEINGDRVSTAKGSISISTAIEERSTCSFVVVDIEGKERYQRGMNVDVYDNDGRLEFSGIVEKSSETRIAGVGLFHNIDCVDWHYLADKRIVAKRYEDMTSGEIVKDLVKFYLAQEGVTYNEKSERFGTLTARFNGEGNDNIIVNQDGVLSLRPGAFTRATPIMTSNTSPRPNIVSTSDRNDRPWLLFDDRDHMEFAIYRDDGKIQVTFDFGKGNAEVINGYRIQSGGTTGITTRSIRDWEILAFDEYANAWTLLDNPTNITWTQGEMKQFDLNNEKAYQKYQLKITRRNGTNASGQIWIRSLDYLKYGDSLSESGTLVSEPIKVNYRGANRGTTITWDEDTKEGTSAIVETSIDGGVTWLEAENGYRVPNLYGREELYGTEILTRVTLSTMDKKVSPKISNIKIEFMKEEQSFQTGVHLQEVVFNYIPVSEALTSLAEKTGYWWDISPDKTLRFAERSARLAPYEVNTMSIIKDSLTVENGNSKYRNQQYIIGGKDISDTQVETFRGNDVQTTFAVGYKIAVVPTVYIDNVKVDRVGIRGLEDRDGTDIQWFWSKGDNTITQNKDATPLRTDQRIRIEYQGEFDVVVVSKDDTEIALTQGLEGGTGVVEAVTEDKGLTSRESAFASASKELERFAKKGRKIKFNTWIHGLEAGQMVTVDFPIHGIEKQQFLIDDVEISYENEQEEYSVSASHNLSEGSWAKFFYDLATSGRTYVVRENIGDDEVLTVLETFSKTWTKDDNPNIYNIIFPSNQTFPTSSTYPSFEEDNRIKYLAFYTGRVEVFRKQITKQTIVDDNGTEKLITTVNISPNEANDLVITDIAWFGGHRANQARGSGIMIDKREYSPEKDSEISLQIDRIDTKGW